MIDLTLNNGVTLPTIGLGVFQSPPEETAAAVEAALRIGYRHIDTAAAYGNERQVGEGLRRSGVDRNDVFIETKVWVSDYGYDQTLHAFEKATGKLGVDTLDLLILHQPVPHRFDTDVAAYKALETLLADGKVRAIGVSNFMPHHLDRLLAETEVVPAVNQVELHPYFTQPDVQQRDAAHGSSPGVVADRRNHLLPRTVGRRAAQRDAGCHHRRYRDGVRQDCRAGHAALGHPAGPFGHPEVDEPEPDRGELRRVRLRAHREDLARIDALDTGVRGGPDPDQPSDRFFALQIPEA